MSATILALLLQASITAETPASQDRALTHLALTLFRRDGAKIRRWKDGLILIDPRIPANDDFPPSDADEDCAEYREFADSLMERNREPSVAAPLVSQSRLWRLATAEELERPLFMLDGSISTLVRLQRPAYSADGGQALVAISFVNGQHIARVNFFLRRTERGWAEACWAADYWP